MVNNNNNRLIAVLEIGSSKIRGAVGAVDNSGVVNVIAVEEERVTDNRVRYGIVQNVEVLTALMQVIERLEAYSRIEPRQITGVYVALGGRSLVSGTEDVSITLPPETEITAPIITDLCKMAADRVGGDRDVVEVIPVRFSVDNKVQTRPIGSFGSKLDARMTVLSCAPQMKRMLYRVITERIGLTINGYVTRAVAEADLTLTDDEKRLGCMFVDFGAETTTVAIYKGGTVVYVATLPIGSRNITFDLTTLNHIEERADEIKRVGGNANPQDYKGARVDGMDYTEINNYIHARADEIVANIIAQIKYAGLREEDLNEGIVIVGGGARLRGFNELLAERSKMKVRRGAPSASIRILDGGIDPAENVDVISLLVAASKLPEADCFTRIEQTQQPLEGSYETLYGEEEDEPEEGSRIGRLDAEDTAPAKEAKKGPKPPKGPSGLTSLINRFKKRVAELSEDNSEEM